MLTSMFYYQHYKPYMIKTAVAVGDKIYTAPSKVMASVTKPVPESTDVSLNKTLNTDVISYAKGIYKNVTELKYTSGKLGTALRNYSKYSDFDEFDQLAFEDKFQQDIEEFANAYNKSKDFLANQPHSSHLNDVSKNLENLVNNSQKLLSHMGLTVNEKGEFVSNEKKNTFWNGRGTEKKITAAESFFDNLAEQTTQVLNSPMSKHMNFKNLSYYYNYAVDNKVKLDSFQAIKTGLLVNLQL